MNHSSQQISRRQFLATTTAAVATSLLPGCQPRPAPKPETWEPGPRYKIAACDWMLLKRQKVGAFALAKQIGLDGLEVDMGGLGNRPDLDNKLRDEQVRKQFLDASKQTGVQICSLAMSCFYAQSYADHPGADRFTDEWIDLMQKMGVKVGFLPLGVKGDMNNPDIRDKVIIRLRRAAPRAERAGVRLGIETNLDARGNLRLIDRINSPAVGVYYNFATAMDAGRDINQELRQLGRKRIVQIHCTDRDGAWLSEGRIDIPKIKQTLDEIGWSGWLVLERSRRADKSLIENFTANARYLKSVFQSA